MTTNPNLTKKAYYSARTGDVEAVRIDLETLRALFIPVHRRFVERGYFDEVFGKDCVDAGLIPGTAGGDIESFFFLKLRKRGIWPIFTKCEGYSEPDLFSVIELLYDVVSKPNEKTGHYHSWSDCGWHFKDFDKAAGQRELRESINEILSDYGDGFTLSEDGQVTSAKRPLIPFQATTQTPTTSTFDSLFTFGLPIGLHTKPSGAVEFGVQGQTFSFRETDSVGVLRGDVYPNFCMTDLERWAAPKQRLGKYANPAVVLQTPLGAAQAECLTILHNLCQTASEKQFLKTYLETYVACHARSGARRAQVSLDFSAMKDRVPALLPQAWINWRSDDREALNVDFAPTRPIRRVRNPAS
ncbi:hypothetical protein WMF20_35685 [Sorangium sp. So ce834]|uniref:hypothetical protein n=1 Tax=Sorangium sp. So ce834 TaxID=3133321 RepID=UPI003F63AF7F